MDLSPILLFVYNRPDHTRRCVESVLKNSHSKESEIYIYSDAAKEENDKEKVNEVRSYIKSIKGFKKISIIERRENWGLSRNIIDGVTTQINIHGAVIVLEDDLVVAPFFLKFMNDALKVYKNEPKVGHIQGCNFIQNIELPDTFFIKWTGSWGWATWSRAWRLFNPNGKELLRELEDKKLTNVFDFNGKYRYTRMLRRQIEGKNDSWAIRWNASLFLKDILSLNAGKSLVQNKGFDGSGTNCGGGNLYSSDLYMGVLAVSPITPIVENKEVRQSFSDYYANVNSFWIKVIRRIKRTIKGDFGA